MGADIIVIRHPNAGAPYLMAQHLDVPVINAGDGLHEHPSQALLDAYTILRNKKTFKGLQIAIVGDIFHSRVARSACHLSQQIRHEDYSLRTARTGARNSRHPRTRRARNPPH